MLIAAAFVTLLFCLCNHQRRLDHAAKDEGTRRKEAQTVSSHDSSHGDETTASFPLRRVRSDAFSVGSTASHLNRRVPWPWRWLLHAISRALFMPPDAAAAAAVAVAARASDSSSASRVCTGDGRRSDTSRGADRKKIGGQLFTCCQDTTHWLSDQARLGGPQLWARSETATGTPFDVSDAFVSAASGTRSPAGVLL